MTLRDEEKTILVKLFLEKAELALAEARGNVGTFPNVAVTRAYYSAYYATQAFLRLHDFAAKTHEGANHLLNEKFVKPGILPRDLIKTMGELESQRYSADYNPGRYFSSEEAKELVDQAEKFVGAIKAQFEKDAPEILV